MVFRANHKNTIEISHCEIFGFCPLSDFFVNCQNTEYKSAGSISPKKCRKTLKKGSLDYGMHRFLAANWLQLKKLADQLAGRCLCKTVCRVTSSAFCKRGNQAQMESTARHVQQWLSTYKHKQTIIYNYNIILKILLYFTKNFYYFFTILHLISPIFAKKAFKMFTF